MFKMLENKINWTKGEVAVVVVVWHYDSPDILITFFIWKFSLPHSSGISKALLVMTAGLIAKYLNS